LIINQLRFYFIQFAPHLHHMQTILWIKSKSCGE